MVKINRLCHVWIFGLLIAVFSISGCAGTNLYSINIYYDAKQAAIPASLKAFGKSSDAIIAVAEFNDARQMDDRLVIGRVVEEGGIKYLVVPKNIKATKAVSSGIKEYLRKAGYKIPNKIEQWDLKEENIPQGVANIVIGGNIDELEIYCRRGFPTNSYKTKIKLTVVFANMVTGKILYTSQVESDYSREHVLFSENVLEDQADIALGGAIEKLFEDRVIAQKIKEAIAQ